VEREGNPKMAGSIAKVLNKYFMAADVGNYHYNNLLGLGLYIYREAGTVDLFLFIIVSICKVLHYFDVHTF
jgi:hypothetical protein